MPRTAVIILNWNALQTTLDCVAMVRDWGLPSTDVIVVDNASAPEQRQQLKSLESTIGTVLYNDVNCGYAGGNNRGIRWACSHNYDAVLLLNNDASIDTQSIKLLQETLAGYADAGIVGPLIYDAQFTNLQNAGGLDIAVHDITHRKVPVNESQPYVVDYVSGTVYWRAQSCSSDMDCWTRTIFSVAKLRISAGAVTRHAWCTPVQKPVTIPVNRTISDPPCIPITRCVTGICIFERICTRRGGNFIAAGGEFTPGTPGLR